MAQDIPQDKDPLTRLLKIMECLRNPDGGCPWDLEQDFSTIAPHTIEEAYEVADAINRGDMYDIKDELGDLLFQVVFYGQMAKEAGHFTFHDIAEAVANKMIHRHPHVFGDMEANTSSDVLNKIWEQRKDDEKKAQEKPEHASILDDVPLNLPAVIRAQKLQKRASRVGFDWGNAESALDKLYEEIGELREAIASDDQEEIKGEFGDVFFSLINVGRKLGLNCEESIQKTNTKFYRRFSGVEKDAKAMGKECTDMDLPEMEALWVAQKQKERA
jgi:ATP diphosphatase